MGTGAAVRFGVFGSQFLVVGCSCPQGSALGTKSWAVMGWLPLEVVCSQVLEGLDGCVPGPPHAWGKAGLHLLRRGAALPPPPHRPWQPPDIRIGVPTSPTPPSPTSFIDTGTETAPCMGVGINPSCLRECCYHIPNDCRLLEISLAGGTNSRLVHGLSECMEGWQVWGGTEWSCWPSLPTEFLLP